MLQFRQIQALHAVMVTGTVTQAAAQLKISQPAVSNLINSLEHQVGFSFLTVFVVGCVRPRKPTGCSMRSTISYADSIG